MPYLNKIIGSSWKQWEEEYKEVFKDIRKTLKIAEITNEVEELLLNHSLAKYYILEIDLEGSKRLQAFDQFLKRIGGDVKIKSFKYREPGSFLYPSEDIFIDFKLLEKLNPSKFELDFKIDSVK